jgi:hypothetical protein
MSKKSMNKPLLEESENSQGLEIRGEKYIPKEINAYEKANICQKIFLTWIIPFIKVKILI